MVCHGMVQYDSRKMAPMGMMPASMNCTPLSLSPLGSCFCARRAYLPAAGGDKGLP